MPGSTMKTCVSCNQHIRVACKTCKLCGATQPIKKRIRIKKGGNTSKLVDAAQMLIDRFQMAGLHPILLFGYQKKSSRLYSESLSGLQVITEQECESLDAVQSLYKSLLSAICERENANASRPLDPDRQEEPAESSQNPENMKADAEMELSTDTLTPCDDLQVLVVKEVDPTETMRRIPSLDQEESELSFIKEEEKEVYIKQEEADITAVTLKSEDSEDEPESSRLHLHTEDSREDSGGPEEASSSSPDGPLKPDNEEGTENTSETDESEDDWREAGEIPRLKKVKKKSVFDNTRGNTGEKLCCFELCKMFAHKSLLLEHENCCVAEKPFSCAECGRRFTRKDNLRSHKRIHTGEKPFSCSDCGKRFSQKMHLKSHRVLHTGEKPYSCSECGKRYNRKGDLRKHEKIHTGEKPFSCDECGKRFTHLATLKSHERIHTGEKPFTCCDCGKRFIRKGDLRKHERIHKK